MAPMEPLSSLVNYELLICWEVHRIRISILHISCNIIVASTPKQQEGTCCVPDLFLWMALVHRFRKSIRMSTDNRLSGNNGTCVTFVRKRSLLRCLQELERKPTPTNRHWTNHQGALRLAHDQVSRRLSRMHKAVQIRAYERKIGRFRGKGTIQLN